MNNPYLTSVAPAFVYLRVECNIPGPAVQPIIALTKAFGVRPLNINGASVIVSVPARLAELFEACVRGIAGIYPDPPTPKVYLF